MPTPRPKNKSERVMDIPRVGWISNFPLSS
jgi:hypothetical protein